jgi:hypothetical protein
MSGGFLSTSDNLTNGSACIPLVFIAKRLTRWCLFFSFRALSENNWDYQNAAEMFKTLHTQGKIPPEAFAK